MTDPGAIKDIEGLLEQIDQAIDAHRDPDPREVDRLQRWRRELLLQLSALRRGTRGD